MHLTSSLTISIPSHNTERCTGVIFHNLYFVCQIFSLIFVYLLTKWIQMKVIIVSAAFHSWTKRMYSAWKRKCSRALNPLTVSLSERSTHRHCLGQVLQTDFHWVCVEATLFKALCVFVPELCAHISKKQSHSYFEKFIAAAEHSVQLLCLDFITSPDMITLIYKQVGAVGVEGQAEASRGRDGKS